MCKIETTRTKPQFGVKQVPMLLRCSLQLQEVFASGCALGFCTREFVCNRAAIAIKLRVRMRYRFREGDDVVAALVNETRQAMIRISRNGKKCC